MQNYSNIKPLRPLAAETGRVILQILCFYSLIEIPPSSWNACQQCYCRQCCSLLTGAFHAEQLSSSS